MNLLAEAKMSVEAAMVSGTEALVLGMIDQAKADRRDGHHTAGFVSGYRGSPFGNVDFELWRAGDALREHEIVFQPGLNEDMAATACWGTQQVPSMPDPRFEGVFAFWYGKGPGVDRTGDVFKHGNLAGTSPLGGVVVLAGDDHGAKSSTTAHQSEQALIAAAIPVLNPGSIAEYRAMMPAAVALSRFAGVWTSVKCVTEIVEASGELPLEASVPVWARPEVQTPPGGYHIAGSFSPMALEESLYRYRLPVVRRFVLANGLDRVTLDSAKRSLGIVAPGKAHVDLMEALRLLDIAPDEAARRGIRIYKPMMTWPLESENALAFCSGHTEILVIEEKRDVVEGQLAQILYGLAAPKRPVLVGKKTPEGDALLPEYGELSATTVAIAIQARLVALGLADPASSARIEEIKAQQVPRGAGPKARLPMFCSGCPHNRSTRLPEGSEAFGGIGCHGMAMWIPELKTRSPVHMGGEGGNWLGIAPFGGPEHIFQNMGDGTYTHSGLLAIRAAIAADVNITYKILLNSATAMTGGQPTEREFDAATVARQTLAEGAKKVIVVSEEPSRVVGLPPEITLYHRDELMRAQEELRIIKGVTVLVYDQGCAAERRRLRKKGDYPDPAIRSFINSEVCEGCGDCNQKSSCVSVLPVETEHGTKRRIDQESCNKDFTCTEGFCPSFVTVHGGGPRKQRSDDERLAAVSALLSDPLPPQWTDQAFNVVLAGIGGTGIVTLGTTVAKAAAIEGQEVLTFDVTGVSQKNGAVFTHLRFVGDQPSEDFRPRVPAGQLDALVGCDIMAATAPEVVQLLRAGRTRAVFDVDLVPTADFQRNAKADRDVGGFKETIGRILPDADVAYLAMPDAARSLVGSGPLLNILLLGYAFQRGLLPLKTSSIEQVIGAGRSGNLSMLAFRLGRLAALDPSRLSALFGTETKAVALADRPFDSLVARCRELLTAYQNARYADRYEDFVRTVQRCDPKGTFSHAVAVNLFRLMRYKDEYEVARLYADPGFRQRLDQQFEGDFKLVFHLAPPLLPLGKTATGEPRKIKLGGWMMMGFRVLQHFKFLRGTPFDPFGQLHDRKLERQLIRDYRGWIEALLPQLGTIDYDLAVDIANLPQQMKGYGPVKTRNTEAALARYAELTS